MLKECYLFLFTCERLPIDEALMVEGRRSVTSCGLELASQTSIAGCDWQGEIMPQLPISAQV